MPTQLQPAVNVQMKNNSQGIGELTKTTRAWSYRVLGFQVAKTRKNIGALMMRTLLCVLLTALVSCSVSAANQSNPKVTLTFIWHAGDRANLLQKIAQKYTAQTGVKIMAVLLRIGWPVRVAFFRGPDGDLIELLQDKTGYT